MSNVYELEPPTNGRVTLKTTVGDIEIGLWSKEAPKAARNFIQHCLEGYYNKTVFHRIIPSGDPTGTGHGGDSIYGAPFKDEFHQRLRFTRRGLVAMANSSKPNTNLSQFFITLGSASDLNNKNTIFGNVIGNTLFNVLKMNELETDINDRPLNPPYIIRVEENPFPDISQRINQTESSKIESKKDSIFKHLNTTKNLTLLSFGDDVDEDIPSFQTNKSKSLHDVVKNDPSISSEAVEITVPTNDSSINEQKSKINDQKESYNSLNEEKELKKDQQQKRIQEIKKQQEQIRTDMAKNMLTTIRKKKRAEKIKNEVIQENILDNNMGLTHIDNYAEFDVGSVDDLLKLNLKYMVRSKKSKLNVKKGKGRQEMVMEMLKEFNEKLNETTVMGSRNEIENPQDQSWMNHKLNFEVNHEISNAIDANVVSLESYDLSDPRNPINQRKRKIKDLEYDNV